MRPGRHAHLVRLVDGLGDVKTFRPTCGSRSKRRQRMRKSPRRRVLKGISTPRRSVRQPSRRNRRLRWPQPRVLRRLPGRFDRRPPFSSERPSQHRPRLQLTSRVSPSANQSGTQERPSALSIGWYPGHSILVFRSFRLLLSCRERGSKVAVTDSPAEPVGLEQDA
jgi:hypothetical protein